MGRLPAAPAPWQGQSSPAGYPPAGELARARWLCAAVVLAPLTWSPASSPRGSGRPAAELELFSTGDPLGENAPPDRAPIARPAAPGAGELTARDATGPLGPPAGRAGRSGRRPGAPLAGTLGNGR